MAKSKTIVLVHGIFVNNNSWSEWKQFLERKGYTFYAPAKPRHEGNQGRRLKIIQKYYSQLSKLPKKDESLQ